MSDLVDFLNVQYDRREKAAKLMAKYYPPPWEVFDRGWMARVYGETPFWEVIRLEEGAWVEQGGPGMGEIIEHVALHGPDWVLADIESKRRIMVEIVEQIDGMDALIEGEFGTGGDRVDESEKLLRLLAAPFSGEPGYDERWAV
jgi:hypothetical protein